MTRAVRGIGLVLFAAGATALLWWTVTNTGGRRADAAPPLARPPEADEPAAAALPPSDDALLRTHIVDAGRRPLAAAVLERIEPDDPGTAALVPGGGPLAEADEEGEVALRIPARLFPGEARATLTLEARCAGFAPERRTLEWKAGTKGWIDDFVLRPVEEARAESTELELAVLSSAGAPIELYWAQTTTPEGDELASFYEEARPGGVLRFVRPEGAFALEVHANGWLPAYFGPFDSGTSGTAGAAPARLECRLAPATGLVGRVLVADAGAQGVRVSLHRALATADTCDGFPIRMEPEPWLTSTSAADGAFLLSVEEPGTFYARAEREGLAPAEAGPFELDPRVPHETRLALGPGGSLSVHLRTPEDAPGMAGAGALVAFSRGDGRAFTRRADATGTLEVDGLTPGPWQVRLAEQAIEPEAHDWRPSPEPIAPIPWNCEVSSGSRTVVELRLAGGAGPCVLDGHLTVDGAPAEDWLVRLDHGPEANGSAEPLREPGHFRLEAGEPGGYRLFLTTGGVDPSAMLVLVDPLELVAGENPWALELTTGALRGTLPPPAPEAEPALLFHQWRRGDLVCLAPILPDAQGRFQCARVPAGAGRIVRFAAGTDVNAGEPEVLREVVLEPGQTLEIEL